MNQVARPTLFLLTLLALSTVGCTFNEYWPHYSDEDAVYAYERRPYHPGPAYVYQQPRPTYHGDGSRHMRDPIEPQGRHLGPGKHNEQVHEWDHGLEHGVQIGSPMRHGG